MAKIRKFCAYRTLERPYTRYSKYKKNNYVRGRPTCRIVRHVMGDPRKEFPYKVVLVTKGDTGFQIRDNAIESARLAASRTMEKVMGKSGYLIRLRIYPHHVLRENPLAAGAGADRMSTGMAHSFGKPIGRAAQVKAGQVIIECNTTKDKVDLAKKALKQASQRLPNSYLVQVVENKIKIVKNKPKVENKVVVENKTG